MQVVRIGHPARLVESVLRYSLDALLSACDSAQIMEDVTKDLEKALVSECVCVHMCVWCVCPCGVCIYVMCVCVCVCGERVVKGFCQPFSVESTR